MSNQTHNEVDTCPLCKVGITKDDEVLFSHGKPGSRQRLYTRVCQYARDKTQCINQKNPDGGEQWEINPDDEYRPI